jgi:hypothetical protein
MAELEFVSSGSLTQEQRAALTLGLAFSSMFGRVSGPTAAVGALERLEQSGFTIVKKGNSPTLGSQ